MGSGWATVVTEVLVLFALGAGVARIPGLRPFPWSPTAKTLGAGAVDRTRRVGDVRPGALAARLAILAVLYLGARARAAPERTGRSAGVRGEPPDDLADGDRRDSTAATSAPASWTEHRSLLRPVPEAIATRR